MDRHHGRRICIIFFIICGFIIRAAAAKITVIFVIMIRKFRRFFRTGVAAGCCPSRDVIRCQRHSMPIIYRRHARARNYVLRLCSNKTVVVTVPRAGTMNFARDFVASRKSWLEKQWRILETRKIPPQLLQPGMEILFRGEPVVLRVKRRAWNGDCNLAPRSAPLPGRTAISPSLESYLQGLAKNELAVRARQLAEAHQLAVKRVAVRNQKTRWGSCSHNGTISLNWRLIQLPAAVRDYIIIHELMHLRELNHSPRFWAEVEKACPDYRAAEEWLKKNSGQVGF